MPPDPSADQAQAAIQAALGQIGFCLPGTITIRRTRCGKPRCACAADPPTLHGPYIQWTRTVHGKTVTRLLTPAQYQAYAPWFASARRLRELAAELEALSLWSTPSLVETRFSPDALVWVTVVFHGTAAWRNHGLIIFPLLFIEHLSSCAVQLPRLVGGLRPPGRPGGVGHLLVGHPALRRGFPGLVKGDASALSPATPEAPLTWAGVPWHPSRGRRGDTRLPPHPS